MGPGSPVLAAVAAEFGAEIARPGRIARSVRTRAQLLRQPARLLGVWTPSSTLRWRAKSRPPPTEDRAVSHPSRRDSRCRCSLEAPQFAALGDVVVAITAPEAVRAERAVARGMERSDVLRRISVQASDSARACMADLVIENDGTLAEYLEALNLLWDEHLAGRARRG